MALLSGVLMVANVSPGQKPLCDVVGLGVYVSRAIPTFLCCGILGESSPPPGCGCLGVCGVRVLENLFCCILGVGHSSCT